MPNYLKSLRTIGCLGLAVSALTLAGCRTAAAHHGQVLLRGYVANDALRTEAGQIAAQVPGVIGVENDLTIRPNAQVGAATSP